MLNIFNFFRKAKIYEYYYLIFLVIVLIQLFIVPSLRLGVITSFLILFVSYYSINKQDLLLNTNLNKLVLGYLLYNTFSAVFFVFSDIPISVFFAEWSNSVLPVFFFYFSTNEKVGNFKFYNITLFALIAGFLIGFYLWVNDSELYKQFMETTEGPGTDLLFFQSLFGLTATGSLALIGFLISSSLILRSNGVRGKLAMLICIIATILTFRRGPIFSLFFSVIILHYLAYLKFNFLKKRYFIVEILFVYIAYKYYLKDYDLFFESFLERSSEVSQSVGERSFTWTYAFKDLTFIFGKGLGTFGHKSIGFSKNLIADGNYFKIIGEIGMFGAIIFFSIIFISFWNGAYNLKNKYLDVGIIFCMSIVAVGSNIFTYQSIAPIFWYSVGRLSHQKKQST